MNLITERLILRPLVLEDAKDIQKHFPHYDIVKYLSSRTVKWPYPDDGAQKFLANIVLPAMERGDDWYWGITSKDNPDEVIGIVHLRRDSANGNRSFWVAHAHQGKGYMSEALEAVNDFAFNVAGFESLTVKNAHENTASNRLKAKTGAELLGIVEVQQGHYIGPCTQQEVWHISRDNWKKHKLSKLEDAKTPAQKKPDADNGGKVVHISALKKTAVQKFPHPNKRPQLDKAASSATADGGHQPRKRRGYGFFRG